jgi:CheY-like chemotaxis protein
MGGRIWVESEGEGRGCTFHFVARLFRNATKPSGQQSVRASARMLQGKEVIFADDNASCRAMLERHASVLGLKAELASCGADVINLVQRATQRQQAPAAIVLDSRMHDMSGMDVARRLQEVGCTSKIVLMTHKHFRCVGGDRAAFPWDAECLKPVKLAQLQRVLVELLSSAERPNESSPSVSPRGSFSASARSRLRILVAEDVVVNQRVATMQIQKCGYSAPDVVSNGQEALDALARLDYDVVFMVRSFGVCGFSPSN